MKPVICIAMLLVALFSLTTIYAQSHGSSWGYGFEGGVARGDNAGSKDIFVPSGRGYLQLSLMQAVQAQFGISYLPVRSEVNAVNAYETKTLMGDARLLLSPIQIGAIAPFIYGGFGMTKDISMSNSNFLMVVPAGAGIKAKISPKFALDLHAGYNLVLSDKFDGVVRTDANLNRITNDKKDGFYNLMLGFVITNPFEKAVKKVAVEVEPEPVAVIDPMKIDTDGDGLMDGEETGKYRTDPLKADTDMDGLSDGVEVLKYKTDPNKADTDGDGLNDYAEVYVHSTDPLKIDTDGGGMNDGAEVIAKKNPLDAKDDAPVIPKVEVVVPKIDTNKIDTDSDGLTDYEETTKYKTDPLKMDTDMDGLSDGDEVIKYHTDPLNVDTDNDKLTDSKEVTMYKTDPNKTDTDNDGLSDYEEVITYHTDPLNIDTDGGGRNDGAEVKVGKNPLDSSDDVDVPKIEKKMILEGIKFAFGKATILPESEAPLDKIYQSLKAYPEVTVLISGHTDSVGNDDSNRSLSLRRAQAVKDWLNAKGIDSDRIKVIGKGEAEPIASNDTDAGRAQNRRIEIEAIQ
jgi:outer membrane protein OmpA-like peptidoglycan-associated protein